jgi:hypothetical protein
MPGHGWRTSSHSSQDGNCVEVGDLGARVVVRDTRDRGGPVLAVTGSAWQAFTATVKTGKAVRQS